MTVGLLPLWSRTSSQPICHAKIHFLILWLIENYFAGTCISYSSQWVSQKVNKSSMWQTNVLSYYRIKIMKMHTNRGEEAAETKSTVWNKITSPFTQLLMSYKTDICNSSFIRWKKIMVNILTVNISNYYIGLHLNMYKHILVSIRTTAHNCVLSCGWF
jgi:hypothetical protein